MVNKFEEKCDSITIEIFHLKKYNDTITFTTSDSFVLSPFGIQYDTTIIQDRFNNIFDIILKADTIVMKKGTNQLVFTKLTPIPKYIESSEDSSFYQSFSGNTMDLSQIEIVNNEISLLHGIEVGMTKKCFNTIFGIREDTYSCIIISDPLGAIVDHIYTFNDNYLTKIIIRKFTLE